MPSRDECWCEYVGAYRGLLEQKLLPMITPKENLLECEVLESSLLGGKPKTLREYAEDNLKLKNFVSRILELMAFLKPIIRGGYMMSLLKKISSLRINKQEKSFCVFIIH